MDRLNRTLALVGAAAVALGALALARRRRTDPLPLPVEERERSGAPQDRGRRQALAIDVSALRDASGFEPVVQYLTYVQSRRGGEGHLLFVRHDDLDALAGREGLSTDALLQRLEQLGVVVSSN